MKFCIDCIHYQQVGSKPEVAICRKFPREEKRDDDVDFLVSGQKVERLSLTDQYHFAAVKRAIIGECGSQAKFFELKTEKPIEALAVPVKARSTLLRRLFNFGL